MSNRYHNNGTGRDTYVAEARRKPPMGPPAPVEPYTPIRQDMARSLRISQRIIPQPMSVDTLLSSPNSTISNSSSPASSPMTTLAVGTMHPTPRKHGNSVPPISPYAMESLVSTSINREMTSPYRVRSGGIRVAPQNTPRVEGRGVSPTRPFNVKQYVYESTQARAARTGMAFQPDNAGPVRTQFPEIRARYQSFQ